jgi:hypothetical protein
MSNYANSGTTIPLAPCEPRWVSVLISYSSEQGTLPTASLISKQVVPYRTCGGTYCPGVSTPMTRSLANSSMTNPITWWIPSVSTIPNLAQTTASNHTTVTAHHDRWKTNTLNSQHKSNSIITKMERLVWQLKTVGLSITTNHKNPILKNEGLGNQLMHVASVY